MGSRKKSLPPVFFSLPSARSAIIYGISLLEFSYKAKPKPGTGT